MLTLYFLNSSRAIRIAWILEELGLEYELVAADRAPNGQGPPDFKAQIPSPLAKSPTIKDGSVVVTESGAIIEYLCEKTSSPLLPNDPQQRADVRQWLHAAEGTFMLHASAILYARWNIAEEAKGTMADMEERMSKNVVNDMNWLEGVLAEQKKAGSGWIVGDKLTAADIQMQFSIEFMLERKLGNKGHGEGRWPETEAWLERTKEIDSYKRAVKKTGYTLSGNFKQ